MACAMLNLEQKLYAFVKTNNTEIQIKTMKHESENETTFFIGDQEFKSKHDFLSVKSLLVDFAKQNPSATLLARKHEHELITFPDLDEKIHIETGMRFLLEKIEKEVVFFIEKQECKTDTHRISVKDLLVDFAKEDPTQTTLARKEGTEIIKYTDLGKILHVWCGMKFFILHNGPTPVS